MILLAILHVAGSVGLDHVFRTKLEVWRFCRYSGFLYKMTRKSPMDALAEKLDTKLRTWKPETAAEIRQRVAEMIEVADGDALDLMRSRAREQEVLDILDEPPAR